jgi:hypothetical protein
MPPAAYALASDTLIGVVRTSVLARQGLARAAEEFTLLAIAVGVVLWLLRLCMAPVSTLAGARAWVLEECPVAPGPRVLRPCPAAAAPTAAGPVAAATPKRTSGPRGQTKTARFLALVSEQHGPLAGVALGSVGRISAVVAPAAHLNRGSARTALRRAVLAAQKGELR